MLNPISFSSNRIDSNSSNIESNTRIESIAKYLAETFNDEAGLGCYFSIAKQLPKPILDRLVGLTKEAGPRKPGAYFNVLAHQEIRKLR